MRCPRKALSFPSRIILGRSGLEHLVDLAAPLLLLLWAESSPTKHFLNPQVPTLQPVPFPRSLSHPILTQRCYLPNTLPTLAHEFCLLVACSVHAASPDPASSLYCSKVHCGPTDLACGSNQAVNPRRWPCASRLRSALCFSRISPVVSRFVFALFSDVHFKNNKTPELDC